MKDKTYQELNDLTFNNFLEHYYYDTWRKNSTFSSIEIIFSPKCNLKCAYCYVNKNNENIYDTECFNEEQCLKNVKLLLEFLSKKEAMPILDIFSGELFAQEAGYHLIETILDFFETHPEAKRPPYIIVPTNGTFIHNDILTKKIADYKQRFINTGTRLFLSYSIDGKYADQHSRKYKSNLDINLNYPLDDNYYEKLFSFMAEQNDLPHPMIAPENIDYWIENFLWFEEMMEKNSIPVEELYMLEVRNFNWTPKKIQKFIEFEEFLLKHMYEKYNYNKEQFIQWLTSTSDKTSLIGFTLLGNIYTQNLTGTGCTLGKQLMIRADDLKVFPCHRLTYPDMEIGHFIPDKDNILKFVTYRPELGIALSAYTPRRNNLCKNCNIQFLCLNQCAGSCYEVTGDMFTPIPSVCNFEYAKAKTFFKVLIDLNLINLFIENLSQTEVITNLLIFLKEEFPEYEF